MVRLGSENRFPLVRLVEDDPPSAAPSGQVHLFADTDKLLYQIDDAGLITALTDPSSAAAHVADTTDAHDASAVSVLDAGGLYAATDVEAALAEVGAHVVDTTDAHDASAVSVLDAGGLYAATDAEAALAEVGARSKASGIDFVIDGGGAVITTGLKGFIRVPFAGTITAVRMLADLSGSIVVDIWKDTYANHPPANADSITASANPTISGAVKSEDTTLTGWTTAVSAGDILAYNVDSCTTITTCTVSLAVTVT